MYLLYSKIADLINIKTISCQPEHFSVLLWNEETILFTRNEDMTKKSFPSFQVKAQIFLSLKAKDDPVVILYFGATQ